MIGGIAGALVIFSVELFELRLAVDDPGGSISSHAIGGLWGVLAVGLFARIPSPTLGAFEGSLQPVWPAASFEGSPLKKRSGIVR